MTDTKAKDEKYTPSMAFAEWFGFPYIDKIEIMFEVSDMIRFVESYKMVYPYDDDVIKNITSYVRDDGKDKKSYAMLTMRLNIEQKLLKDVFTKYDTNIHKHQRFLYKSTVAHNLVKNRVNLISMPDERKVYEWVTKFDPLFCISNRDQIVNTYSQIMDTKIEGTVDKYGLSNYLRYFVDCPQGYCEDFSKAYDKLIGDTLDKHEPKVSEKMDKAT